MDPMHDDRGGAQSVELDAAQMVRLGKALGPKYVVRRLVGRGGFCDVYEVWDSHLERRLAVKLLRDDLPWGPGMAARFEREARALGALNHLNIPPVHFVGDNEGLSYFAMPFIEGRSLAELLADAGPFEPRWLVELMIPVVDALGHAHRCSIVHRDIKPENIIVDDKTGRPQLVDFGVAKELTTRPGSSMPGVILGTPAYISPEQVLGEPVDHRSDIYAVGSTMYHLLTGQTIFSGDHPRELIRNQLTGEIPVPSDLNSGIPLWLSSTLLCALERRPEDRFQSAAAMAEALRAGLRLEAEDAEWVEASFAPSPFEGEVKTRRATDEPSPPWLRQDEELPAQAERWGVQLRWVLATIGVSLMLTWVLLVPTQLVLRNHMLVPVSVHLPRGTAEVVAPGAEARLGLGQNWNVALQWDLKPLRDARTFPPGEPLTGVLRIETVDMGELFSKRIHRELDVWKLADAAVAPRVMNRSTQPVVVRLLPAQAGQPEFQLAPGSEMLLGYYRWSDNIGIEVRAPESGRTVVIRPGLPDINEDTGEYKVQITDSMLNAQH